MDRKHLDSLQKRRIIVQSISEHSQNRRWSIQKFDPEQHKSNKSCATYNQDNSSDQSNDNIIENSDTETHSINVTKRTNITTSTDGDLNTSTISLPFSNSGFFGDDVGKLIPPNSPFKNDMRNEKKINIISVEVIKRGNTTSHTNTYSGLSEVIEDSTNQPVSSNSLSPVKSWNNNFELADEYGDRPENSCSPILDLNSLTENFHAAQSKASCQITPTKLSTLDLELSLHADSCTTLKVSNPEPCLDISLLNTVPLNVYDVKQSSALPEESQPGPSSTQIAQNNQKIRNKRTLPSFKKSCMDFLPEEEILDFSAGSSDDWTCNESESDGSSESPKKKKKKLNKRKVNNKENDSCDKRKREKKINQRRERRKLKEAGKAYEDHKGDIIQEKTMKPNPCVPEKCKRRCYTISEDRRKSLFDFFWSLDTQRRKDWIVNSSRVVPIARKRIASPDSRRNLTYEYYVNNGNDHQKVCQKFLLETLDLSQKYLLYTLQNSNEGMSSKDRRSRTKPDIYSTEAKEYVKTFIEKLPAVPSHYCRKKSNKVYLPQDLKNVTNLYRIYRKECDDNQKEAVGESVFKKIFNDDYNISFHIPKKDKCLLCTRAEHNDILNEDDKKILKDHLREKTSTYERFLTHQNFKRPENDTLTTSFDLQKVLTTPHGNSMLLGYARKYAVFNFTLYESGTQNVYCYIWGECDAKRGSQEIASCLYKYFQEVDRRHISHLILYCDSCAGQNKNKVVLALINFFLKTSINLQTIQINFLLPGHTYMPVDSVHATIEREVKKITVWSPSQWAPYISSARKRPRPYEVVIMDNKDFINWEELASKTFTRSTLQNIQFKNIRIATFKKQNTDQVEIKYSTDENSLAEKITLFKEPEKGLKVKGKGKGKGKGTAKGKCMKEKTDNGESQQNKFNFVLQKLYNNRLPISIAKFKDLKHLCDIGVIPRAYHSEFIKLPHSKQTEDTLNQTDEEDEVIGDSE